MNGFRKHFITHTCLYNTCVLTTSNLIIHWMCINYANTFYQKYLLCIVTKNHRRASRSSSQIALYSRLHFKLLLAAIKRIRGCDARITVYIKAPSILWRVQEFGISIITKAWIIRKYFFTCLREGISRQH